VCRFFYSAFSFKGQFGALVLPDLIFNVGDGSEKCAYNRFSGGSVLL
jgi:hypothetical protein